MLWLGREPPRAGNTGGKDSQRSQIGQESQCIEELISSVSGKHCERLRTGGADCRQPRRGVLNRNAVARTDTEQARSTKIRLGVGLAATNVVRTDQHARYGQTRPGQTQYGDSARRGRYDSDRKHPLSKHGVGAWQGDLICWLKGQTFHPGRFHRNVLGRDESRDHLARRRTVRETKDVVCIQPATRGPLGPVLLHESGRVDQNSVHVDKDGLRQQTHSQVRFHDAIIARSIKHAARPIGRPRRDG